jgi:hypothetical protein
MIKINEEKQFKGNSPALTMISDPRFLMFGSRLDGR